MLILCEAKPEMPLSFEFDLGGGHASMFISDTSVAVAADDVKRGLWFCVAVLCAVSPRGWRGRLPNLGGIVCVNCDAFVSFGYVYANTHYGIDCAHNGYCHMGVKDQPASLSVALFFKGHRCA